MSTYAATAVPSTEDSLAHLESETRRFVEVAARSPLGAHVPTYPAFTVETLSAHIGNALRVFHTILSSGSYSEDQAFPTPVGAAVIEWVEEGVTPLLTLLSEIDPERLVSFPHGAGDRPARLIAPLLAVEVGIHRWDVESVLGDHAPIPTELAIAEIDKVFENFVPRLASSGVAPIGGIVELRANDAGVRWILSVQDGQLHAGRPESEAARADVVVSASTQDLALIVWKRLRPPRPGVEISGPLDVLRRLLSVDYIPDPQTTPAH
jgi:uncharacterized protein (TIGR03083 family)